MKCKDERILLFGGTTEGRQIARELSKAGIPHTVSVATEYGKTIMKQFPGTELICGRKSAEEMAELIQSGAFTCAVDATHPYAREVSENIRTACGMTGIPVIRIRRETGRDMDGTVTVPSLKEAAERLDRIDGNLLLLTGSRELPEICSAIRDRERLYARVLPDPEAIPRRAS